MEKIEEERLSYAHWLYNIPGVGRKTIKYLLSEKGTPEAVYHLPQKELECLFASVPGMQKLAERITDSKKDWKIKTEYEKLKEKGIRFTCLGDKMYPRRLAQIPDAPYGLYFQGKFPAEELPSVAIIGARNCSEYGRRMAQYFGKELARAGVQIISGMARGIDGISQMAALETGGYSLGVLGCGVDICYPAENRELYGLLREQGGICSEYPPGTEPRNSLFPPRNRIISGLSDAVLVIEAKNRSGTLITVDMALEQGREVYALPGRVTDALSEGCNRLIHQGAAIAFSAEDMIRSLMGRETGSLEMSGYKSRKMILSDIQKDILENLEDTPQIPEMIKERMLLKCGREIQLSELMNQLVRLSLMGYARQIGNSYFVKV